MPFTRTTTTFTRAITGSRTIVTLSRLAELATQTRRILGIVAINRDAIARTESVDAVSVMAIHHPSVSTAL